jgi:hypothetical protein
MIKNEKGFVLPAVVMLLLLMSALTAIQLHTSQFIIRHLGNQSHKNVALYAADGMVEYGLAVMPDTLRTGDSVVIGSYFYGAGLTAEISLVRTDTITNDTIQTYTLYGESQLRTTTNRIVALDLVIRGKPLWDFADASFLALGGLDKNGSSGLISGNNVCGDSVPAIIAGDSILQNGTPIPAPGSTAPWIDGGLEYPDSLESSLGFEEWDMIRNTASDADFVVNSGADWPSADVFTAGWPSIYMNSTFYLTSSHSGRGVIIAPNNLTIGTGFVWEGIILIGGALTKNGAADLEGTIASGLNKLLGMTVNESDIGNGTMNFVYNSCSVMAALTFFNPVREPQSWRIIR